jgi:hypothetical protein
MLQKSGIDLSSRGAAVQEALWSTSTQYGASGANSVFKKALQGRDLAGMSDADIINAVQEYKGANVSSHFRSSSLDVQQGVANRIKNEQQDLLAMANRSLAPNISQNAQTYLAQNQTNGQMKLASSAAVPRQTTVNNITSPAQQRGLTATQTPRGAPRGNEYALQAALNADYCGSFS